MRIVESQMGAISLVTALTGFELGSGGIEPTTTCYRDRTRDLSLAEIMCGLGSTQLGAIPPPSLEAKFFRNPSETWRYSGLW